MRTGGVAVRFRKSSARYGQNEPILRPPFGDMHGLAYGMDVPGGAACRGPDASGSKDEQRRRISPTPKDTPTMLQWPKLHRAFELRDQLKEWVEDNNRLPEFDTENNASANDDPIVWQRWRVRPGSLSEPTPAALLLGDVVHNWRSALDHQLWEITPESVKKSSQGRSVQFPLNERARDHRSWMKKWEDHYGPKVLEIVEAFQPYQAPEGQLHPLAALKSLSNTDKHRTLNVVNQVSVDVGPVVIEPAPTGGVQYDLHEGPLKEGEVVATVAWTRTPGPGFSVTVKPTFAAEYQIALPDPDTGEERWHALGDLMNFVGPAVAQATGMLYNAHRVDSGLPQKV